MDGNLERVKDLRSGNDFEVGFSLELIKSVLTLLFYIGINVWMDFWNISLSHFSFKCSLKEVFQWKLWFLPLMEFMDGPISWGRLKCI